MSLSVSFKDTKKKKKKRKKHIPVYRVAAQLKMFTRWTWVWVSLSLGGWWCLVLVIGFLLESKACETLSLGWAVQLAFISWSLLYFPDRRVVHVGPVGNTLSVLVFWDNSSGFMVAWCTKFVDLTICRQLKREIYIHTHKVKLSLMASKGHAPPASLRGCRRRGGSQPSEGPPPPAAASVWWRTG